METDFGKIAYLKACDLETQVNLMSKGSGGTSGSGSGKRTSSDSLFFHLRRNEGFTTTFNSEIFNFNVGTASELVIELKLYIVLSDHTTIHYYLNGKIFEMDTMYLNSGTNNFSRSFNLAKQSGQNNFYFTLTGKGTVVGYDYGVYGANLSTPYDGSVSFCSASSTGYLFFENPKNNVNVNYSNSVSFNYAIVPNCKINVPYSNFQFVQMENSSTRGLFKIFILYTDGNSDLYIKEYVYETNSFGAAKFLINNVLMFSVRRSNYNAGAVLLYMQGGKTYKTTLYFTSGDPLKTNSIEINFGAFVIDRLETFSTINCEFLLAKDKNNKWYYSSTETNSEVKKFPVDNAESLAIYQTSNNIRNVFYCRDGKVFKKRFEKDGTLSEEKYVTFGEDVFSSNLGVIVRGDRQFANPFMIDTTNLTT